MMLNRREFLAAAGTLALASQSRPDSAESTLLMISREEGKRMQASAQRASSAMLNEVVDHAAHAGPWSVTFNRPAQGATNAGPNDYFSEGPYWWPNPQNPAGPYIRKDGRRNPQRFTKNGADLKEMCQAVLALGMGAYLLNKPGFDAHASEILSTWFIDPKTKMNPNLEYGQAIRGVTTGRGTGMIDTVSLIYAIQGIALLEAAGALSNNIRSGTRQWFAEYLRWMTTSTKGLHEKHSGNNHATWWTAQAAAYSIFTGDTAAQHMTWNNYREYLVPTEIKPDGSCPREEARTKSLSYSAMNLDAFAVICRLAQLTGTDLWHYTANNGASVEKAFNYLLPYILHPNTWSKEQIESYTPNSVIFPALAGIGLPSAQLLTAYKQLPRAKTPWILFIDLLAANSV